jgi:hypothetical protein
MLGNGVDAFDVGNTQLSNVLPISPALPEFFDDNLQTCILDDGDYPEEDVYLPDEIGGFEAALLTLDQFNEEIPCLELMRISSFHGETVCFIRLDGSNRPLICREGDMIDIYMVESIQDDHVRLADERGYYLLSMNREWAELDPMLRPGSEHGLMMNDSQPHPVNRVQPVFRKKAARLAAQIKTKKYDSSLKYRTRRVENAILVEDGGSAGPRTIRVSRMQLVAGLFQSPMNGLVSSRFGYRRYPMGGGRKFHRGIDIVAPFGKTVVAAAEGLVTQVRYIPTLGKYITIEHANGYRTRHGHLSRQLVREGEQVRAGQMIGREGNSGRTTGAHLHFEIWKDNVALNPLFYIKVEN